MRDKVNPKVSRAEIFAEIECWSLTSQPYRPNCFNVAQKSEAKQTLFKVAMPPKKINRL